MNQRSAPRKKIFAGRKSYFTRLGCGAALMLGLLGCSKDDPGPPLTDVTGAWATTTWITAYVPGPGVNVTWTLFQDGTAINGSFADNLGQHGTVEGSIGGYEVFLTFRYSDSANRRVDFEATADASTMSGVFRGEGEVKLGKAGRLLTQ